MGESFDVAVIGAGSAGCVVASRLVASGRTVALVEAGPDYGRYSRRWPRDIRDPRRRTTSHDWGYEAETTRGQVSEEQRARVVGGCSAHNECAAVWPPQEDFDAWAVPGWSAAELWPLVDGIEAASGGSIIRGRSGPLITRPWNDGPLEPWQAVFVEGAVARGHQRLVDASAPGPATGVAFFHANVRDGVRWNAAFAFLDPVRRRRELTIFAQTEAVRLVRRADRAELLECRSGRRRVEIRADRYVLCAGAYGSPLLLLRSGLRMAELGRGLQDHPGIGLTFRPARGVRGLRPSAAYRSQVVLRASSGTTPLPWDLHILPYQADGELSMLAFFLAPASRGSVDLHAGRPRIRFRFFSGDGAADLAALASAVDIARDIASVSKSAVLTDPALQLRGAALRRWIRANVGGYAHAVGTCRMGTDDDSVVDERCRVRGLRNAYVADASIIPRIPRANTNLTCVLIGARAAQMI